MTRIKYFKKTSQKTQEAMDIASRLAVPSIDVLTIPGHIPKAGIKRLGSYWRDLKLSLGEDDPVEEKVWLFHIWDIAGVYLGIVELEVCMTPLFRATFVKPEKRSVVWEDLEEFVVGFAWASMRGAGVETVTFHGVSKVSEAYSIGADRCFEFVTRASSGEGPFDRLKRKGVVSCSIMDPNKVIAGNPLAIRHYDQVKLTGYEYTHPEDPDRADEVLCRVLIRGSEGWE